MKLTSKTLAVIIVTSLALDVLALGKPAPSFRLRGSDGRTYTAKKMTRGKPVLLVFFTAGCPHNVHGIADMNRLVKMLRGRVRLMGITNLNAKETRLFALKHHTRFPVLADPKAKTIAGFGATASLDNALVLANGTTVKMWNGYNQSTLKQLEAELRRQHGPSLSLDLASFPKDRQSGCPFPEEAH